MSLSSIMDTLSHVHILITALRAWALKAMWI